MWILKNGSQTIDCASFPYAFRAAYNFVRKAIEAKQDAYAVQKQLSIVGPPNARNERKTYSYTAALELAEKQGLLTPEGGINSREFKRKYT